MTPGLMRELKERQKIYRDSGLSVLEARKAAVRDLIEHARGELSRAIENKDLDWTLTMNARLTLLLAELALRG